MSNEHQIGSLHTVPVGVIADRAARWILESRKGRAVTVDPEGRVWVEPIDQAAECDLVGVYTRDAGLLELTRLLSADLLHEKQARGLAGVKNKRRVVGRPWAADRRAA